MSELRIMLEGRPEKIQRVADAIDQVSLAEIEWQEVAAESLVTGSIIVRGVERPTLHRAREYHHEIENSLIA